MENLYYYTVDLDSDTTVPNYVALSDYSGLDYTITAEYALSATYTDYKWPEVESWIDAAYTVNI